jgi:hypothetical protein
MNAYVSDDKNYHSVPVDERYRLPNDMDVKYELRAKLKSRQTMSYINW